ncbi:HAMP domain-containing histidine kinase [Providencia rettgeri]|uniref:HAMP domain-containing histidine kinase n=1 Tax=Providencia rettgeri TaxID=587 RepID=A0A939SRQ4_PRORE|nr:HAMP domain-containing histidine kinase [Providencia rettgeri]
MKEPNYSLMSGRRYINSVSKVVEILDHSSKHLQQLIEQLLDYNRKLVDDPPEAQIVDLQKLIEDIVKAYLPARLKY